MQRSPLKFQKKMSARHKTTRSRNGCLNCRKRKKKCDEIKPICTGCLKRHLVCIYKDPKSKKGGVKKKSYSKVKRHVSFDDKEICMDIPNIEQGVKSNTFDATESEYPIKVKKDDDQDLLLHPGNGQPDKIYSSISLKDIVGKTVVNILAKSNLHGLFGSNKILPGCNLDDNNRCQFPSDIASDPSESPNYLLNLDPDIVEMLVDNDPLLINFFPNSESRPSICLDGNSDEIQKTKIYSSETKCFSGGIPDSVQVKLPVDLTYNELSCFEYYCKKILPDLSILPQEFNYYSRIYIPMAFKEKAILYTLVGWGCKMRKNRYLSYQVENKEADKYISLVNDEIDRNSISLTRDKFITNFVCYMLLVCMEISYGDTVRWSEYFTRCFNMINRMPGNFKYLLNSCSTEGALMAENFAYFDVLASQSNKNGTFYPIDDYRELFSSNTKMHDPLQGCIRPIILLIGETVSLLVESSSLSHSLDLPDCDEYDFMSKMMTKSIDLDERIKNAKPDSASLRFLYSPEELEYHLTLFEVYQLSAQIYLREVIRKLPPVVPEMAILAYRLRNEMKIIIECKLLKKSLAFPMLLLGTTSSRPKERKEVAFMFESLIQHCGYLSSYQKLWIVVQKIWDLNKDGALYVDWFRVTEQFGWRLNLGR